MRHECIRLSSLCLVFVAGASFAIGCGSSDELDGDITISGSSTVQPLASKVAGAFVAANPRARIDLQSPGTGEGFLLFCDGLTDVNNASRPIEPAEKAACSQNGVEYVEFEVARDAAVVATSDRSPKPECLDFNRLYSLTGPEAAGSKVQVVAPTSSSGTTEVFSDLAIAEIAEKRSQATEIRRDAVTVASDQLVGDAVRGTPGSIGILGYSVAGTEQGLRLISLDGGDGCVLPQRDTIEDGTYPLIRSLYVYVNMERVADNPTLKSFVDGFVNGDLSTSAIEAGSIPVPDSILADNEEAWSEAGG